jgi:hypothetical protein
MSDETLLLKENQDGLKRNQDPLKADRARRW